MDIKKIFVGVASLGMIGGIAVAGPAVAAGNGFPPITGDGYRVQNDTGSCNNGWATVSLDKAYKLTRVSGGVYNLEVKESGTLTTLPGKSPGACESGTNNGNTVVAGITGLTHQTFDALVTSSSMPNAKPDCSINNACAGSGDFLNAVFGAGNYVSNYNSWTDVTFTAHYEAGSNGTYFDTSTNWPLNNRGDIT
jgi:hypothetical protein